uniref:O-antigen ligase family protein n=1 Tax=Roseihalotalea indica TaxID=2867963 RepID=A0AA49GT07_9BACT|nr:hypothetical protein K4G66_04495 [Tunicatimonas sp. TK19036]
MTPWLLILAFITVILAGLLLIQRKDFIFFAAFVCVFTPLDYIDRFFFTVPSAIRWLPFLAIAALAVVTALLKYRYALQIPKGLVVIYALILGVSGISLLMNHSSGLAMLVAQRGYIMIFSFLVLLKNVYGTYTKEDIYRLLVWIGVIHFPIALFQRVVFVSLLHIESGDMVSGLLPIDGFYLFFQCICVLITMVFWLRGQRIIPQLSSEITLLLLLGSVAIGANKAGLIMLFVIFGFVIFRSERQLVFRHMRKIMVAGVAVGMAFITFTFVYNQEFASNEQSSYTSLLTDPAFFIRYNFAGSSERSQFTPSGRLKRGAAITFSWKHVNTKLRTTLLGLGPGATAESNLPGANGGLANRYPNYYINRVAMAMYLGDLGIIGLGLHMAFLLYLLRCTPIDLKKDDTSSRSMDYRIREGFVFLALVFYTYENLYFEPMFALLIAVMAYPYAKERAPKTIASDPVYHQRREISGA